MKLSISEAARRAGVERNTLYRKLNRGLLSKEIGEDGKPVIDLAELARLYPNAVTEPGQQPKPSLIAGRDTQSHSLHELVSVLKEDKERLQQQLDRERDQHKGERDRLLDLLEAAQRKLTGPAHTDTTPTPTRHPQPPRSFWARLTGQTA